MKPIRKDGPGGRFYNIDGVMMPSVTNILSAIAKPLLVPWAAKVEREAVTAAAADVYQQWATQPTTRTPLPRSWFLTTLAAQLGKVRAHERTLTAAGDLGTEAHQLIEWHLRTAIGSQAGPQPLVRPEARHACQAFLQWATSVRLKPVLIERQVYSLTHGYAGTLDILCRVNGVPTIIDLKTSTKIYPEAGLQLAAYSVALEDMGYLAPAQALIVRLPKVLTEAAVEVQVAPSADALFPTFLAAKQLWTWQQTATTRPRTKVA